VDQGKEDYGKGKVLEQGKQDGQEDEEFQEGADEVSQHGAEDKYLAGYVDLGHQAGLVNHCPEGGGGAGGEEAPCHDAHQEVGGEVFFLVEEVAEDKPEDEGEEKGAEERPEEAQGGVLVAVFELSEGEVLDEFPILPHLACYCSIPLIKPQAMPRSLLNS